MEDEKIVDLFLQRDEAAIEHCRNKYGTGLRCIANNLLQDFEIAEECESDTYLKAWKLIPPNEPRNYLFSFLARIIRNIALDYCKMRGRQKRSAVITELSYELQQSIPDKSENVEEAVICKETVGLINDFLRQLPKTQRVVFMRRYWYMASVKDIAKEFGFSESKVKSMLFRTRQGLKRYLEEGGRSL